ncbi:hypothetical protein M2140_000135 [Clostridiales Family XIII bacterium PM5-7]
MKPKVATRNTPEDKMFTCTMCGKSYENPERRFFKTKSKLYEKNDMYYCVCRSCLEEKFEEFKKRYDERTAMLVMCHYLDVPFYYSLYDSVIKNNDKFTIGLYFRQMNTKQFYSKTFVNTLVDKKELGIDTEKYEVIKEEKWSVSDTKTKNNVIETIGYDPFEGYDENQRKFLFTNIAGYLGDDGIDEDNYKISQIIQLVNNNYQISQIDMMIPRLNTSTHLDDIKSLNKLKKDLVDSNDKIAKQNGISVNNRKDQEVGKSTLTHLMKKLRELDFDDAEENYYNQLQSAGSQWAANMSFKSIMEHGFFDENDREEVFETQRNLIEKLQKQVDDTSEENRLLKLENIELKEAVKS